jgi:hypothetical protein
VRNLSRRTLRAKRWAGGIVRGLALVAAWPAGVHHGSGLAGADDKSGVQGESFTLTEPAEVVAVLTAACAGCAWGVKGREAAVLALKVDGRYSQDLPLVQGAGPAVYRVLLGDLAAGTHTLEATLDPASAPGARGVTVEVAFERVPAGAREHVALAHAPILHQRANAVGRFTDVPLVMYYEVEPAGAGRRLSYTVIFSNEDGGTPPDRLMATWGRLTDIELVYSVELSAEGAVVREVYQGRDHKMLPFSGAREGRHPLLWVVTDNNMVSDRGRTRRRHRPAPQRFDLAGVSREAVMDAHPWTYRVMSEEVLREGRVVEGARPGSEKIPDPRRYAFVEACADVHEARLAFDVAWPGTEGLEWVASDAAGPRYRVARSGCFRAAVALPRDASPLPIHAIRLRAHTRPAAPGEPAPPPGAGWARVTRVNRLFRLGHDFLPGPDLLTWTGDARLSTEGTPLELIVARENAAARSLLRAHPAAVVGIEPAEPRDQERAQQRVASGHDP